MQYRGSAVDKMKIEPVKISFMENATTSKMVDQNDDFLGEYKTWTPGLWTTGAWTLSVDQVHGMGPSKYGLGL